VDHRRPSRRALLRACAAAGVAGLAGCAGDDGDGGAASSDGAGADGSAGSGAGTTGDADGSDATATPTPTATDAPDAAATAGAGSAGESVGMTCRTRSEEYFFRPAVIRVPVGGTVAFGVSSTCRQRTLAYHPDNDRPLRIPEAASPWASDVMQGSGTFAATFDVEGVYDYAGLHEEFGQVGTVVAGEPDPADQPGLAPPQSSLPEAARAELARLNDEVRALLSG
jgi:plastocyanin